MINITHFNGVINIFANIHINVYPIFNFVKRISKVVRKIKRISKEILIVEETNRLKPNNHYVSMHPNKITPKAWYKVAKFLKKMKS